MKNNKKFGVITELWPYLQKYKLLMIGAVLALSIAATTVLFMGWGLRNLVDHGFADGNVSFLNNALMTLFISLTSSTGFQIQFVCKNVRIQTLVVGQQLTDLLTDGDLTSITTK